MALVLSFPSCTPPPSHSSTTGSFLNNNFLSPHNRCIFQHLATCSFQRCAFVQPSSRAVLKKAGNLTNSAVLECVLANGSYPTDYILPWVCPNAVSELCGWICTLLLVTRECMAILPQTNNTIPITLLETREAALANLVLEDQWDLFGKAIQGTAESGCLISDPYLQTFYPFCSRQFPLNFLK